MHKIGTHNGFFETCKVCREMKLFYRFGLRDWRKVDHKSKSRCKVCLALKKQLPEMPDNYYYSFDPSELLGATVTVTRPLPTGKIAKYKMSRKKAMAHIHGGVAGITGKNQIDLFYDERTFRNMVLKRDRYICTYCGKNGSTIDHIIPKMQGGLSTFSNCVCACKARNNSKGSNSIEVHLEHIGLTSPLEKNTKIKDINMRSYTPCLPLVIGSGLFEKSC